MNTRERGNQSRTRLAKERRGLGSGVRRQGHHVDVGVSPSRRQAHGLVEEDDALIIPRIEETDQTFFPVADLLARRVVLERGPDRWHMVIDNNPAVPRGEAPAVDEGKVGPRSAREDEVGPVRGRPGAHRARDCLDASSADRRACLTLTLGPLGLLRRLAAPSPIVEVNSDVVFCNVVLGRQFEMTALPEHVVSKRGIHVSSTLLLRTDEVVQGTVVVVDTPSRLGAGGGGLGGASGVGGGIASDTAAFEAAVVSVVAAEAGASASTAEGTGDGDTADVEEG